MLKPRSCPERAPRSLESKFGEVKHDVAKFCGHYADVENLKISGANAKDMIRYTKEKYFDSQGPKKKEFPYLECWEVLRFNPRWSTMLEDLLLKAKLKGQKKHKKKKAQPTVTESIDADGSDTEVLGGIEVGAEGSVSQSAPIPPTHGHQERPVGQKFAKRAKAEATGQENALKSIVAAQKLMADTNVKRIEILVEQSMQTLYNTRVSDLDVSIRAYFARHGEIKLRAYQRVLDADDLQYQQQLHRENLLPTGLTVPQSEVAPPAAINPLPPVPPPTPGAARTPLPQAPPTMFGYSEHNIPDSQPAYNFQDCNDLEWARLN